MKFKTYAEQEFYENIALPELEYYEEDNDVKLTEKQKKEFLRNIMNEYYYINKDLFVANRPMRQSEKENGQIACLVELMLAERKHLSIEEMSEKLVKGGFPVGSSVKTIYRRIIPELRLNYKLRKDNDNKYFIEPEQYKVESIRYYSINACFDSKIYDDEFSKYQILLYENHPLYKSIEKENLGQNQKVYHCRKGKIVEFEVRDYKSVLRWVLSLGTDVEPLVPQQLIEDWKDNIKKLQKFL